MARVIITLLDSFGIGWAHDAAAFGGQELRGRGPVGDKIMRTVQFDIPARQRGRSDRCFCLIWLAWDWKRHIA